MSLNHDPNWLENAGSPEPKPTAKPGSGIPAVRPPGRMLTSALQRKLAERTRGEMTLADEIAESTIWHARKGNAAALKIVWDRSDGPVNEQLDIDQTVRIVLDI